jgi:hypothetical protein
MIFVPGQTNLRQALKSLLSWMWRTRQHSTSSHCWPLCLRLINEITAYSVTRLAGCSYRGVARLWFGEATPGTACAYAGLGLARSGLAPPVQARRSRFAKPLLFDAVYKNHAFLPLHLALNPPNLTTFTLPLNNPPPYFPARPARRPIFLASVLVSALPPCILLPPSLLLESNIALAVNPRRAMIGRPPSSKRRLRCAGDALSRDGVDVSSPRSLTTFRPFEFELSLYF